MLQEDQSVVVKDEENPATLFSGGKYAASRGGFDGFRSTAPTLLTALALPPPLNFLASAVVSSVIAKYLPPEQAPAQVSADGSKPVLGPEQVTQVVANNAGDPQFILELRQAEIALKKYETDAGISFAQLEVKDRADARGFQRDTGLSAKVFTAGMLLVLISMIGMVVVVVGALALVFGGVTVPAGSANVAVAAFGLIGTAVGFINGLAASIVNFYWGSSFGSKDKSDDIAATVQSLGEQLEKAASRAPVPSAAGPALSPAPVAKPLVQILPRPAAPAQIGMLAQVMPELTALHKYFPGSVTWALTKQGISVDGASARGTAGDPTTVTTIWKRYGEQCKAAAKQYSVPVELIVATIATESGGDPTSRRPEPALHDESVGLMQTLVATARDVLGRQELSGNDLLSPALSIEAGTAYIAQQHGDTHFDPPLVAAAYNAGHLRLDDGAANRWQLRCFPVGTGHHVDKYVGFFADCMGVSSQQDWSEQGRVPSFARTLVREPEQEVVLDHAA